MTGQGTPGFIWGSAAPAVLDFSAPPFFLVWLSTGWTGLSCPTEPTSLVTLADSVAHDYPLYLVHQHASLVVEQRL